jgi:hypothetical protein
VDAPQEVGVRNGDLWNSRDKTRENFQIAIEALLADALARLGAG